MRFRLPSILFRRVQVPDEGEVVLLVANSLSFSVLQNIHQINVLRSIYSSCSNRHRRTLYLTDEFSLTFPCVAGRSRYSAKAGHPTCLSRRAEMERRRRAQLTFTQDILDAKSIPVYFYSKSVGTPQPFKSPLYAYLVSQPSIRSFSLADTLSSCPNSPSSRIPRS